MTSSAPLTPEEQMLWQAVVRLIIYLPRVLDADLVRGTGLSLAEYGVLSNLSEAPSRQMRMTELAASVNLSPSRITRLISELQLSGLVRKDRSPGDARGSLAVLTADGLSRLQAAYPVHLASARKRLFDHLDPATIGTIGQALRTITPPR